MEQAALTRALTFAQANLDSDLSLKALAAAANRSPHYFARRFALAMAETPKKYIARLRLERAALRLLLLDDSIVHIALDCGFAHHETFCRAFRRYFGVPPKTFRRTGRLPKTKSQEIPRSFAAEGPHELSRTIVRSLQPMSLAFIRHTGPYENVPAENWDKLIDWAKKRRLAEPYVLIGIARDAPGITPPENLRFDAAIRVPDVFRSENLVGYQAFPGGLFAFTTSAGPFASLPSAYREIFNRVLSDRTLVCDGVPCLEFYRVNRIRADLAIVHTEIGVPVRRVASHPT